eukprot:COSAG02_NODE_154_length_33067_cov_38.282092_12_plen_113_part_00
MGQAFPPWDEAEHEASLFVGVIDEHLVYIPHKDSSSTATDAVAADAAAWANLTIVYDVARGECDMSINEGPVATVPMRRQGSNEGVVSYLALRVHGTTALCVRSIIAEPAGH